MNGLPVPGVIPKRVMSSELIVVGSPWVVFGILLMTVLRPKSLPQLNRRLEDDRREGKR